jgi:hypothetical protein
VTGQGIRSNGTERTRTRTWVERKFLGKVNLRDMSMPVTIAPRDAVTAAGGVLYLGAMANGMVSLSASSSASCLSSIVSSISTVTVCDRAIVRREVVKRLAHCGQQ